MRISITNRSTDLWYRWSDQTKIWSMILTLHGVIKRGYTINFLGRTYFTHNSKGPGVFLATVMGWDHVIVQIHYYIQSGPPREIKGPRAKS